VTQALGGTPWTEIAKVMPTGRPYGYLTIIEAGQAALTFNLDHERHALGRDATQCDLAIPERFERTSRKHALLSRVLNDVYIDDVGSSKGTFVDGQKVTTRQQLRAGQHITLGGPAADEKVCLLEFALTPRVAAQTYITDSET